MTDAAKALLAWLDAARSEPVCIDATWPSYASEGKPKPKRIEAAEELAARGLVVTATDLGPGLWLRYVGAPQPGLVGRAAAERDLDAVLDAVPADKAHNLHAVSMRAGLTTVRTRRALERLVLTGKVAASPGRLSSVYRRIDGDQPTAA